MSRLANSRAAHPTLPPLPLLHNQVARFAPESLRQPIEKIQVDPSALPGLEVANRGLADANLVSELGLCEARVAPELRQIQHSASHGSQDTYRRILTQIRLGVYCERLTFTTESGTVHVHPLVKVERDARASFVRVWSSIGLDYRTGTDLRGVS